MWSSGPASQGQFSGKAWREQVMTRQPAEAKRLTVAWPMPREAPVRISVLRSALGVLDMGARPSMSCQLAARAGYRPHPFGGDPEPPFFDCKRGRVWEVPSQWGAGLAPLLAKREH